VKVPAHDRIRPFADGTNLSHRLDHFLGKQPELTLAVQFRLPDLAPSGIITRMGKSNEMIVPAPA